MSDDERGDFGDDVNDDDYDADLAEGPDELEGDEEGKEEPDDECAKNGKNVECDIDSEADDAEEARAEAESEADAVEAPDVVEATEVLEGEEDAKDEKEGKDASSYLRPVAASKIRTDPVLRASNTHRRIIIVPDDERITSHILSIPEAARAIGIRAKQIETFPVMFADAAGEISSVARAKIELLARRSPLILHRVVGKGSSGEVYVEAWRLAEMVIPPLD